MNEVSVAWLTQRVTAILAQVAAAHGDRLFFDQDYYWSVARDELFDISTDPEVGLGSINDAIESLKQSQRDDGDDVDGHELWWVAAILSMIAVEYPNAVMGRGH